MGCQVLLLNGPSSAGKSSIAKALQKRLTAEGMATAVVSIDDYLRMTAEEPIWEDDVFAVMPEMCRDISRALRQGQRVIVDHVITSARIMDALADAVAGYAMKTVRVTCSPEILRKREAARGNRCAGSAEASLRYIYPQTGYDETIDSGETALADTVDRLIRDFR